MWTGKEEKKPVKTGRFLKCPHLRVFFFLNTETTTFTPSTFLIWFHSHYCEQRIVLHVFIFMTVYQVQCTRYNSWGQVDLTNRKLLDTKWWTNMQEWTVRERYILSTKYILPHVYIINKIYVNEYNNLYIIYLDVTFPPFSC